MTEGWVYTTGVSGYNRSFYRCGTKINFYPFVANAENNNFCCLLDFRRLSSVTKLPVIRIRYEQYLRKCQRDFILQK